MTVHIAEELKKIEELVSTVKRKDAESRLLSLIEFLGTEHVRDFESEIRRTIDTFTKKRKRRLSSALKAILGEQPASETQKPSRHPEYESQTIDQAERSKLAAKLRDGLTDLSDYHIFQWSTFYRDALVPLFAEAVKQEEICLGTVATTIREEFAAHAEEIFLKGYQYTAHGKSSDPDLAILKSISGLQRFLELPVEFYAANIAAIRTAAGGVAIRNVSSAMLVGILRGYGDTAFGPETGYQLLRKFPRSWAHYLGFMTAHDLRELAGRLGKGVLQDGLQHTMLPVATGIDELVSERRQHYSALPALGQFVSDLWRIDISLQPASRLGAGSLIEVQCYLDPGLVRDSVLLESANRGVAVISGPMRPDLQEWIESQSVLRSLVVNSLSFLGNLEGAAQRTKRILWHGVSRNFGARAADTPLTFNFARDFPLHNPVLLKYFHVYRTSVRDLLRTFERRNGVRLWCSVRRSGKTTACFDLSTTTGTSTVVSQTCDSTEQQAQGSLFYDAVVAALESGRHLPKTFFRDAVERSSAARSATDGRYVFVLDEYETLFEHLRSAVAKEHSLRYSVAQPLLNQLVAFSREHLLVFMGQRPDAYYIFMDQNQLSAYVQQDVFPLFAHEVGLSEFSDLIAKILTERFEVSQDFSDALYAETGGHPYLTAKVLVDLVDWLIEQRRSIGTLTLDRDDLARFAAVRLTASAIGISSEYQFFRQAISEALSRESREQTPWLFAIYAVLRRIAQDSPDSFRCTRGEFEVIVDELNIPEELGYSADYLLSTGAQANFLAFSDRLVWPRIPTLGRIARSVRARTAR